MDFNMLFFKHQHFKLLNSPLNFCRMYVFNNKLQIFPRHSKTCSPFLAKFWAKDSVTKVVSGATGWINGWGREKKRHRINLHVVAVVPMLKWIMPFWKQ